jgi:hypothetical protein
VSAPAPAVATPSRLDWLELGYVAVLAVVAGAAWLTLLLAELGLFRGVPAAVVVLGFGLAVAFVLLRDLRRRSHVHRPSALTLAAAGGLFLLGAAVLARPHEYVLGGLDPGVYVNAAAHLGRTGSLVWWDADVAALSPEARAALFREPPALFSEGSRLIGFYLGGLAEGRVVPHGMHLLSAAMGLGHVLGGLPGLFLVPPVLALVAVAGVGLLARRWAGAPAGALAAALLLVSPAESWFGRYPAAELWVQVAVFGGAFGLLVALVCGSRPTAFAAGALFGLSHLAKVDTFVVALALAGVVGGLWLAGRLTRLHTAFAFGYALMLVHALLHVALISTRYTYSVYSRWLPPFVVLAALAVAGAALLVAAWTLRRRGSTARGVATLERRRELLWAIAVALLAAAAFYGWYVRPLDLWRELAGMAPGDAVFVRNRLHALPRLGWYVPPLAILLALTGYALALRRLRGAPAALLLLLLPLEALVVFGEPRINAEYPWAARRWVGLIVPGMLLFASAQLAWLAGRVVTTRTLLPAALAGVVGLASLGASLPLLRHREYAGSPALIESIAAAVEPRGVVLFDDDLVGWRLSAPLALIAGRSSFVLFSRAAEDELMRTPLGEWTASGRPVYWLRIGEPRPAFQHWGRTWQPGRRWTTGLPEARFDVPVTLYRAVEP